MMHSLWEWLKRICDYADVLVGTWPVVGQTIDGFQLTYLDWAPGPRCRRRLRTRCH